MNEDGAKKNNCERNASERLLRDFRTEHPYLPVIVAQDALSSNGPHLKLLIQLNMSFITVNARLPRCNLFRTWYAFA